MNDDSIKNASANLDDPEKTFVNMPPKGSEQPNAADVSEDGQMILGQYKVLAELGRGGMGVVYRCLDKTAEVEVAVKTVPPEVSRSEFDMEDVKDNYRLVEGLVHQNIAAYKALGRDNNTGDYYLVMQLVKGEDLRHWMRRKREEGTLTLETALPILRQVAEALDFAHRQEVVHRDVKPGNIMVQADGTVKVLDFGLAAQIRANSIHAKGEYADCSGTPQYMAPEQWRGCPPEASADQYALAVTAYEMFSGHAPFMAADLSILREIVLKEPPRKIKGIPDYVNNALARGLAKEASDRFATCREFVDALTLPRKVVVVPPANTGQSQGMNKKASPNEVEAPPSPQNWQVPSKKNGKKGVAFAGEVLTVLFTLFMIFCIMMGVLYYFERVHEREKKKEQARRDPLKQTAVPHKNEHRTVTLPGGVELEMVKIPKGSFMMGSPEEELNRDSKEILHHVELTKDFWLGVYEVTQEQYMAIMKDNPSYNDKGGKYPVEQVTWDNAMDFCELLTEMERKKGRLPNGYEYTLPTEAQWEYACRAGKNTTYNFGYGIDKSKANYDHNGMRDTRLKRKDTTRVVGSYRDYPNAWGVYDMHGNVYEWCYDYNRNPYPAESVKDPEGQQDKGECRVCRGGGWDADASWCRSATRGLGSMLCLGYPDTGFRIALAPVHKEISSRLRDFVKEGNYSYTLTHLPGEVYLGMVRIPKGSFMMGSNDGESDEKPVHKVTLTKDFWLGETEVTQAQYEAVMKTNPSEFKKGGDYPVENVSWYDAMNFCKKLTEIQHKKGWLPQGYEYTLPTEAQWECAARGGNKSKGYKYSGSDNLDKVGWYDGNSEGSTHPVKQKKANELGLLLGPFDMSGNVWEWCRDNCKYLDGGLVATNTYKEGIVDPWCRDGSRRVCRGGSWGNDAKSCRSAIRICRDPSYGSNRIGFRLALVPIQ